MKSSLSLSREPASEHVAGAASAPAAPGIARRRALASTATGVPLPRVTVAAVAAVTWS